MHFVFQPQVVKWRNLEEDHWLKKLKENLLSKVLCKVTTTTFIPVHWNFAFIWTEICPAYRDPGQAGRPD